ncbi:MAG: hypothetical protein CO141_02700 [Candidatus Moranbacteria bacterium CG_4_9_14_3_um_filter_42_9]|nr:MAG: hypothetical protein CO141_02700 [Candidatus Moranbacteria bacterium CG_4_9_14_3_um_filter_42_9]
MEFTEKIKKNKQEIILVLLLIFLGIFLRSYNFSDWLHFEIDQSYDTLLVSPAVDSGVSNLPLLGPTAGGGRALRLGPAFYYLEYLSAKVFGNTPPGHAMLVLIFSILSLPLFYLFCRRYFSHFISIGLLAIYCTSLYMVSYSRFSWSPNVLPFLILLAFYSLLRSFSEDEKKKNSWFIISSAIMVIITQIHFNAFFVIPAIVLPLLIICRPRFKLRTWAGVLLVLFILYSPVIISDIETKGQNLRYFIHKFNRSGNGSGNFNEKLVQVIHYNASEYFLIVTGIDHINGKKLTGYGFSNPEHKAWRIAAIATLSLALLVLFYSLWKEKDRKRKDFLWLIVLWFLVSFSYFFFVKKSGFNIYPRFFLVAAPLPFVFFGLLLERLAKIKKIGTFLVLAALSFPLATNARGLNRYFSQLNRVGKEPLSVETEDVFPNVARITLSQQYAIADYIEAVYRQNNYPVYFKAKHEYEPVIWYHLERKGIIYSGKMKNNIIYQEANYFAIKFTGSNIQDYKQKFTVAEIKNFGTLTVWRFIPKPEAVTQLRQGESEKEIPIQKQQITQLFTWNKLLAGKEKTSADEAVETKIEESATAEITEDAVSLGLTEEETKEEINNGIDDLE